MALILLVLLVAILFGGLGFALHALWWIAAIVLIVWARRVRCPGRRGTPLVPLVTPRPPRSR
jgi:hypothetical protein